MPVTRRLLLAALLLAGCQTQTPTQRVWPSYATEVKKILAEYDLAMHEVSQIDLELGTIPGSAPPVPLKPDDAVARLEKNVIPKLNDVATHAASVNTPNSSRLTAMHRPLREALAAKADAYKMMCSAFKKKDTSEFDKGQAKLVEAGDLLAGFRRDFMTAIAEGGPRE